MRSILGLQMITCWELLGLAALSLIAGGANASLLYFVSRSITTDRIELLFNGGLFFLALIVFVTAQAVLSRALVNYSERFLSHTRMTLCRLLLRCRYESFETFGQSRFWSTATHDTMILGQMWPNLISTLVSAITIVLLLAYLAVFSPRHFLVMLILIGIGIAIYSVAMRHARQVLHRARARHDNLLDWINDLLQGMKELKLDHKKRVLFLPALEKENTDYVRETVAAQQRLQRATTFGNGSFFMVIGVIAFTFPMLSNIDDRSQFAFLVVLIYLVGPLVRVTSGMGFLSTAAVAAQRVLGLRETLEANAETACSLSEKTEGGVITSDWRSLSLNQITYTYARSSSPDPFTFGPISLTIKRGEVVFVIGANGAGKTTLAKVMAGLYLPSSGSMTLDDVPITAANIDSYRQLFATIFRDYHVSEKLAQTDGTLRQRLPHVFSQLGFPEDANLADESLEFSKLSHGQRGRIALALAQTDDKSIYLFDEWAADQDPAARAHFYAYVLPLLKEQGKTGIVISHDDRYFGAADRIVTIEHERGPMEMISGLTSPAFT